MIETTRTIRRTIARHLEVAGVELPEDGTVSIDVQGEADRTGRIQTCGATVTVTVGGRRLEIPADELLYADGDPVFGPIDSQRLVP